MPKLQLWSSKNPPAKEWKNKRWTAIFNRFPDKPHLVGAELGVYQGRMSEYLLKYEPSIHMTFVDIEVQDRMQKLLDRTPTGMWDMYEMPTTEAAPLVPDNHFDFVFIDADHSYEAVKQDIIDWLPKVKPGGWLCGHDVSKPHPHGVKKAIDELLPGYELDVNDTFFYRRPY